MSGDGASGAPGGREMGRAREVEEDWRMLSVRRGLHCCMVAPSAEVLDQEIFWGGLAGWSSSGGGGGQLQD